MHETHSAKTKKAKILENKVKDFNRKIINKYLN